MKQFVYVFMQNGADIFRNYIIIKNQMFSDDHMLKMKTKDWSTLVQIFSVIYVITNTNGIFRAFMCY